MKIGHQMNFLAINWHANSLYSLIADGTFRQTSVGTKRWKSLIGPQGSLQQTGCDEEGFNVFCGHNYSKARIGTVGNDKKHCSSGCRSRIGFGMGGMPLDSNTCGNEAASNADNGIQHIKAMGYILVQ